MRMHNNRNGGLCRWHKDVYLPYLPPEDMYVDLGAMANGDMVAGWVTDVSHNFMNNTTYFTCLISDSDEDMDEFARFDGWEQGRG
jgi:hypothetical protein